MALPESIVYKRFTSDFDLDGKERLRNQTRPTVTPLLKSVFVYGADKAGVSNLWWKNDSGVEFDLSNIATSPAIGGTGAAGQVAFFTAPQTLASSTNFQFDSINVRVGVGITPLAIFHTASTTQFSVVNSATRAEINFLHDATPTTAAAIGLSNAPVGLTNDLLFSTLGGGVWSERMRILNSNGNVGIGQPAPTALLDLQGDAAPLFRLRHTLTTSTSRIEMWEGATQQGLFGTIGTAAGGNFQINQVQNSSIDFLTQNLLRMTILGSGLVGVNILTPLQLLHGQLNQNAATILRWDNFSAGTASQSQIQINSDFVQGTLRGFSSTFTNNGAQQQRAVNLDSNDIGGLNLSASSASGIIRFFTGSITAERMRIDNAGNVGVATVAPTNPLHVVGNVRLDSTTQTTIGANGAAVALTANPVGYIQVNIGGTLRIIPFYNQV